MTMPEARYFGVNNPTSERHSKWVSIFGRDWVELESNSLIVGGGYALVKVKVSSLEPGSINRWARMMAERNQCSFESVIVEIHQGQGLLIDTRDLAICTNPLEGRDFWKCVDEAKAHTEWKKRNGIEDQ